MLNHYSGLLTIFKRKGVDTFTREVQDKIKEIQAFEESIEIDYLRQDIPDLVNDCKDGAKRVAKIVRDLKNFVHPGKEEQTLVNINENLETTLNVIHNETKYKAIIQKNFSEIAFCSGFPQKLNQVFMNIIVNATQAIKKDGVINIETMQEGKSIIAKITDNGCGIKKDNIPKIFDPFFTTKEIGKGTGLGLHIAYNIITEHKGSIKVKSEEGKGTSFIITLPASS